MRWEMLFDDLASQFAATELADRDAAVADLTRAELATVTLTDRLVAARGGAVIADLVDGATLQGELRETYPDWVLLGVGGREVVLPTRSVEAWRGLGRGSAPAGDTGAPVARPLGISRALRGLARDRAVVAVHTVRREHVGRIDRVGRDHLEISSARADDWGRPRGAAGAPDGVVLPFATVLYVVST
ncbi:hypothetical protein [Sanguibacter suaedae]|uniref:Uncharacterized protein n=1 Tax=Sanguibacter suaedae TaxID=2795737 RepID=A0A934MC53_9MICO|nr:hypothetical protein [Sanguibacter suaedae]MBI9116036.1 hypothetical protein [Sanguibacter suaedae]